ncbi:Hypothetical_protein [Hexamita inflata]|uniref:Hypothetical_protein n=1 Tax=Hexamita inflata TaxID=28002 RepID=A0AA86Q4D6_9EUKA|nr:Hypothetical protein HINF_LOCUS33730 [Hexamita inflata]
MQKEIHNVKFTYNPFCSSVIDTFTYKKSKVSVSEHFGLQVKGCLNSRLCSKRISKVLHYLACNGGAISLIRVQVNSLIREFHHAKLPYKQVTNNIVFKHVFDHKSFKFNIFPRYILDTFLLIRELKSVTPLQASKHLPYKQGYVVHTTSSLLYHMSLFVYNT